MTMNAADIEEESRHWTEYRRTHPEVHRPAVDWRGRLRTLARLTLLAVGLVFTLAGMGVGLVQPGMWAPLAVVGAVLLFALVGLGTWKAGE